MATLVDYALTTVADVKESLNIASSDSTKNNLIIRKINQATDMIQKHCGRTFKLTQYVEDYDGSNIDELTLSNWPVVVDATRTFSVQRRDSGLNEEDFETVDASLYFVDTASGVVELNYVAAGRWNRYRYSYWAGYATIPNDLAEAANMLACYLVTNPNGLNIGVQTRKEGQREVRYSLNNTNITFLNLLQQLGIDDTLAAYCTMPLASDR